MTSLPSLIERLEAAKGPDRELADEVLLACGWTKEPHGFSNINGSTEEIEIWLRPGMVYVAAGFDWLGDRIINNMWPPEDELRPNPLLSIDAAMSLIPETRHISALTIERNQAEFGNLWHVAFRHQFFGHAVTPAIALCIASLKARMDNTQTNNGDQK